MNKNPIDKIKVLSIAPVFAEAIKRIHNEEPLGDMYRVSGS